MSDSDRQEVINAIAYSRLESQTFTVAECILLHQWHNGHQSILPMLKIKYNNVQQLIKDANWIKPDVKYVDGGELFVEDPVSGKLKKVN